MQDIAKGTRVDTPITKAQLPVCLKAQAAAIPEFGAGNSCKKTNATWDWELEGLIFPCRYF